MQPTCLPLHPPPHPARSALVFDPKVQAYVPCGKVGTCLRLLAPGACRRRGPGAPLARHGRTQRAAPAPGSSRSALPAHHFHSCPLLQEWIKKKAFTHLRRLADQGGR